jgi:tetratricopeptide (TPR) repeat protein
MKKLLLLLVLCMFSSAGLLKAQDDQDFQAGEKAYDAGKYQVAAESYTRYIKTFEDQVPAYIHKKHSYDTSSLYERTLLFSDFKTNNQWAVAYYKRGMANLKNSDFVQAGKDFDMSISIDPNYGPPYFQKGITAKGRDKKEACLYFSKALSLGDTARDLKGEYQDNFCWMCSADFFSKGKMEVNTKQYEEALKNLTIAIAYCHDSGSYYAYRGMAYEGLGKIDSALEDYSNGIKHDSTKNYQGYYHRALAYEKAQKYKEAFNDLTKAISINPRFADAYLHQAADCESLDMASAAYYDYQQVIKLKPSVGMAWYKVGLHKKDNGEDACSYFQKAVELGCDDAQSYADDCKKAADKRALK